MIRSVLYILFFWLYQVRLIPRLIYVSLRQSRMPREELRAHGYKTTTGWAWVQLFILRPRITIKGEDRTDPDRPILIVSNHQGEFDIPLLFHAIRRPFGFVAKQELRKIPLVGKWMEIVGTQFIDRADRRAAVAVIERSAEALRAGDSLAIFPEGTRSSGPDMQRFKTGFARMAIGSGTPILPVALNNTYAMKQRGSYRIQSADISVTLCDPISMEGYEKTDAGKLTRTVQDIIQAALDADNASRVEGHDRVKDRVVAQIIEQLRRDLSVAREAAEEARAMATDPENVARSKYETLGLEAAYLAQGQAQRTEELADTLEAWQGLELKTFTPESLICLSALLDVTNERGTVAHLLMGPGAGGVEVEEGGKTVLVITPRSPIGRAVLGKKQGATVALSLDGLQEPYVITAVQ